MVWFGLPGNTEFYQQRVHSCPRSVFPMKPETQHTGKRSLSIFSNNTVMLATKGTFYDPDFSQDRLKKTFVLSLRLEADYASNFYL